MMKKRTYVLIITVLIVIGILFIAQSLQKNGRYIEVKLNNESIGIYSLNENKTYKLNGGNNILIVEDGYAYINSANCPDKICIKQGKINKEGQCITCLPNKITVTVVGGSDIDFIN